MIEVEVKCPVRSLSQIRMQLTQIGFKKEKICTEHDVYLNHPEHDLRKSDQALRIRTVTEDGRSESFVTFKDKKIDQVSMTREEYETAVADGAIMRQIFRGLGYAQSFDVIKVREYMIFKNIHACLDQVNGLGAFLELEILCDIDTLNEKEKELARKESLSEIEAVMQKIGLRMEETTTTSYLSMLMQQSL